MGVARVPLRAKKRRRHFTRISAPERAQAEGMKAGARSKIFEITISGCRECCAPRVEPMILLVELFGIVGALLRLIFANSVRAPLYSISLSVTLHCTLHSFHAPNYGDVCGY